MVKVNHLTGHDRLAFTPRYPQGLGDPIPILAMSEDQAPKPLREIAWVFDSPVFGRILVYEHAVEAQAARVEYSSLAAQAEGCIAVRPNVPDLLGNHQIGAPQPELICSYGTQLLTSIRDDTLALVHHGVVSTSVHWTEALQNPDLTALGVEFVNPVLEVIVMGHADQLTPEDAVSIANSI